MDRRRRLKPQDYTVAWLCALALSEQVAAIGMLDEMHEDLLQPLGDDNTYIYGSIKDHNIIIACLPLGQPGTISASILVASLPKSFPSLRIHLLVGIGGGIPHDPPSMDPVKDIHLGDVVVGVAEKPGVYGVVQYDFERDHGAGNSELLASLDKPDRRLLTALGLLFSLYLSGKSSFSLHLERLKGLKMDFTRPTFQEDRLYKSSCGHVDAGPYSTGCGSCPGDGLILRKERLLPDPVVHQGQILSGNAVIQNTPRRDELRQRFPEARCFEMEAAGVMDQTHCLVIRGIADYADSHKNQHWQPYAAGTAAAFAREFLLIIQPHDVTDIDPVACSQTCTRKDPPDPAAFTSDEKSCLQSLHFTEMYSRKNDVADPAPSTCAWLLEHPKYCEWLGQGHGMLWIKGKPGAGKSTLLKYALETAERESKRGITLVSFFFHGRGAPMQKNVLGLFRSLLHQILQKHHDLLSKLTSLYKGSSETEGEFGKKWDWHEKQLESFFKQNVGAAARTHQVRIYIDGLDECGEELATNLVEFFRGFEAPISICFSCRHYPFVALEGGNEVCVEQENERDIESYIKTKINIHIGQADIAKAIRDEMVSRSNGNFQWVVLVLGRAIRMHKSRNALVSIKIMIRNIPAELNKLYTTLLNEIDKHERLQSLRLMQWICFAFRPLSLIELRFALAVSADTPHTSIHQCLSSELYVENDEDMERRICDLSKGLAEVKQIDSERVAQFVHQSVKDYLLEQGFRFLDGSSAGTVAGRGHFWLSRSCVKYFLMEEVRDFAFSNPSSFRSDGSILTWKERNRVGNETSMLDYSMAYFLPHVQEVDVAEMAQDDLVALIYEPTDGIPLHSWFEVYQRLQCDRDLDGGSLLHAASKYNLIGVANAILARNPWADHRDNRSRTPLFIAVAKGHKDLVEMLISREDVDVNSKCDLGNTPLLIAAAMGHEAILEMLMDRDDVELSSRLAREHQGSAKELVSRENVDAYPVDTTGKTLLFIAVAKGRKAIVKMLMNRGGVDVNSKNEYGKTPFSEAARFGHVSTTKLLLERGVDLSQNNGQLTTALLEATGKGQDSLTELLLQKNVDVNIRDNKHRTPLSYVASWGNYKIVKLLLQLDANVDSRDSEDRTPLFYAALWGHYEITKLLLRHNATAAFRDSEGRTPLSYAASYGHVAIVKLLLERTRGADQRDKDDRTPCSYAAGYGRLEVVKLFVERGDVDINSKDASGRSPLSWALVDVYPISAFGQDQRVALVNFLLKQSDIIVTEEDRDIMRHFEGFHVNQTKENTEEVIEEEESEREDIKVEQISRATKRKRSPSDPEQPRKQVNTNIIT